MRKTCMPPLRPRRLILLVSTAPVDTPPGSQYPISFPLPTDVEEHPVYCQYRTIKIHGIRLTDYGHGLTVE